MKKSVLRELLKQREEEKRPVEKKPETKTKEVKDDNTITDTDNNN